MQLGFAIRSFTAHTILPSAAIAAIILYIKIAFLEFLKEICFILKEINLNVSMIFVLFIMLNIRSWWEMETS